MRKKCNELKNVPLQRKGENVAFKALLFLLLYLGIYCDVFSSVNSKVGSWDEELLGNMSCPQPSSSTTATVRPVRDVNGRNGRFDGRTSFGIIERSFMWKDVLENEMVISRVSGVSPLIMQMIRKSLTIQSATRGAEDDCG